MTGERVALDTNRAIDVLNGTRAAGHWIAGFKDVYLPVPVVGELRFGALKSTKPAENLSRIESLLSRCLPLPIDLATTDVHARVREQLRRQGRPIPENDVWIAAICVQHGISLATADRHFDAVEGLHLIAE